MKVLTVNIILKDTQDNPPDIEMDGYAMCFSYKDVDKAYELFKSLKRFMQYKQYKRDDKDC